MARRIGTAAAGAGGAALGVPGPTNQNVALSGRTLTHPAAFWIWTAVKRGVLPDTLTILGSRWFAPCGHVGSPDSGLSAAGQMVGDGALVGWA
jgi:hypothetical protein